MPPTLLLADDSVTIQRVIELTFADEEIEVVAVSDGDQAIARLDAAPPDIVLADIGMPGRDGYQVAQYMKQSPRLAHIPVVLLTGAFEPVDQARVAALGCDGVLAKPFEPQLVVGRVKELLARPSQAPFPHAVNPAPPISSAANPVASESALEGSAPAWAEPAPPGGRVPAAGGANVEDYFDRLDAAFATLSGGSTPEPPKTGATKVKVTDELDWFGSQVNPPPVAAALSRGIALRPSGPSTLPDLPLAPTSLQTEVDDAIASSPPSLLTPETFPASPQTSPGSVPPAPEASAHPARSPAVAFVAPPASAQDPSASVEPAAWPATLAEGSAVRENLVEEVTRCVLDRLSDRVVRETAAEIVSAIAERLVREEIERIKASVK